MGRRAGRKRKEGKRHPNGQLVKDKRPDDRVKTSRQPHRRKLRDELRLDERAESVLGRLNLKGEIDNECYDAGVTYAAIVGQYRAVIEAPRSTAGSGRGITCWVESEDAPEKRVELFGEERVLRGSCWESPDDCACLRRKERYDASYMAVLGVRARPPAASNVPISPLESAIARAKAAEGYGAQPPQDQIAAKTVARVAVHGEEPTREDIVHLVRGLRRLVRLYGLTGTRRMTHSQNAH